MYCFVVFISQKPDPGSYTELLIRTHANMLTCVQASLHKHTQHSSNDTSLLIDQACKKWVEPDGYWVGDRWGAHVKARALRNCQSMSSFWGLFFWLDGERSGNTTELVVLCFSEIATSNIFLFKSPLHSSKEDHFVLVALVYCSGLHNVMCT